METLEQESRILAAPQNIATINFSNNWNNKLDCDCFTTIRLKNDKKYVLGKSYNITLTTKGEARNIGVFKCEQIKNFKIQSMNDFIARLDTGYNVAEATELIKRFYKNSLFPIDWEKTYLSLILLVKQ